MEPADEPSNLANDLRTQLIKLKIATLREQAVRMGLKLPGEDISATALRKIEESVVELSYEELQTQIVHWTELSRKSAKGNWS